MVKKHRFIFTFNPYDATVDVKTSLTVFRAGKLLLNPKEEKLLKHIAADSNGRIEIREEK